MQPQENVALAPLSTLGIGGRARWFFRAQSTGDVAVAHEWAEGHGAPLFVLGGGSNVVISDDGVPGCVLRVDLRGVRLSTDGPDTVVSAAAGEPWDPLVHGLVDRGLAGLECLSGIPGSVGGTPIQNVGAYGQEVSDTIEHVTVYDRVGAATISLSARECEFAYRSSRFKGADANRFVVCGVAFRVRHGGPATAYPDVRAFLEHAGRREPTLGDVRQAVLAIRRRKGMVIDAADPDTRSVGSFFMNPIVDQERREAIARAAGAEPPAFSMGDGRLKVPAAWLIERSGFRKGHVEGAAGISTKHPLALVNRGGATARDILRLACRIKQGVVERFEVWLRPEPVFVGFTADPDLDFLQKPH
jgi:UDP-N-acetylmuramate dehydrogenase